MLLTVIEQRARAGAPHPDDESIRLVNCSRCAKELLGQSNAVWHSRLSEELQAQYPPLVAARVKGRPLCKFCHRLHLIDQGEHS